MKDIESTTIESFQKILKDRGWNVEPINPQKFTVTDFSSGAIGNALRQAKEAGVEILLVVLPDRNTTNQENIVRSSGHSSLNRSSKNPSQRSDHPNSGLDPVDYATLKRSADTGIGTFLSCIFE